MEIINTPQTAKGPSEWFTGDAWIDVIVPTDGRAQGRCAAVHFTTGARTARLAGITVGRQLSDR